MKYICLNPYCDYCIDQVEFEGVGNPIRCPNGKMPIPGPAEMKRYQSPELIKQLQDMRERNEILKANIIDIDNIPRGG